MNLPNNEFTHAIAKGKKQIGLWVGLTSNFAANVVAPSGYDWVLVDMEHSPNTMDSVLGQLQVFEASDTTAIVRPEWNDPILVKRLLDMGAPGLLFPMVQTVEEAELAVASTRYPPRGIRGVSGSMRGNKFGRITDYNDRVEDETTVIIQIETMAAISRAEEIGSVDGVSGIFFGPADIAADMGMLGKPNDTAVWDAIMPAAKKLMAMGVPVGTLVLDVELAAKLANEGFTFVACGTDASILAKGSDDLLATMKEKIS
jgi:4-hydroxy-2-oxoheptanedioate aldolase